MGFILSEDQITLAEVSHSLGPFNSLLIHEDTGTLITIPLSLRIVIAMMVLGTLDLGILPGTFLHLASEAVSF